MENKQKDQIPLRRLALVQLELPAAPEQFKSPTQRARVATEQWAARHLYCPRCEATTLRALPPNAAVSDFACDRCALSIQLKAKAGDFGRSFVNSAYAPKIEAIRARRLPDYALLSYSATDWSVRKLDLIPGHFIAETHVIARPPLAPTARRAGWVGSTVRLDLLPRDAFIPIVGREGPVEPKDVRARYARFEFLREGSARSAGWIVDVLREVRGLAERTGRAFALQEFYAFAEERLTALHPENRNVRPKIRQQLQVLRDRGVLEFQGSGLYRLL